MLLLLQVARLSHHVSQDLKVLVLNIEHLNGTDLFLEHGAERLEILLITRCQQGKRLASFANPGRSAAPMDVDLRIKRALVVHHVLHVRNVQTACGHIRAHQDCTTFGIAVYHVTTCC